MPGGSSVSTKKAIFIDGNSLINRAFFAIRHLTTSSGQPTNALYGFLQMLDKLIRDEQPNYLAVAFDKSKATFRHEQFKDYKAHRAGMPDQLAAQLPVAKELLRAYRIPIYEIEGYEADDVLGTMASRAAASGLEVRIVTGDRDAFQLIDDRVKILITVKGISEIELFDAEALKAKYGLTPAQMVDLKGLMGDTSDNIPGVPGVGEKTALKLLHQFGSLEEVLAHANEAGGPKLCENLATYADQARLSRQLATIDRAVPIDIDLEECRMEEPDHPRLLELLRELEFRGLIKRFGLEEKVWDEKTVARAAEALTFRLTVVDAPRALRELEATCRQAGGFAYQLVEADSGDLFQATDPRYQLYIGLEDGQAFRIPDAAWQGEERTILAGLLEEPAVDKASLSSKPDRLSLRRQGLGLEGVTFDATLAAYLLDPTRSSYRVEDLAREHLGLELPPLAGDDPERLATGVVTLARLRRPMLAALQNQGLERLYREIELPLAAVLADMEWHGIHVNVQRLEEMGERLGERIEELTAEIYHLAGQEFNINSTKQLGEILFEKLGLPVQKRTKSGYSTDAEVLEALAPGYEIAARLLEYRQVTKLKSTYIDGLRPLVNPDTGRVHTTFQQTVTATGRLSSTEPNLQNIPIREELGRRLRYVFGPGRGYDCIVGADYSQIELRILAHLSGDRYMVDSFQKGQDIHQRTASEVFGVPMDQVTSDQRAKAKAVNFGIVYGISDYGLARQLGITRSEAALYIANYFTRYQGVKAYMDGIIAQARRDGYVTTMFSRRRQLPDINSRNFNLRSFAERTAINTPIQGSAADIIKLAMVGLHRRLTEEGFRSRMLLQVHDELIFEAVQEELADLKRVVREEMEGAATLQVPLVVDIKVGPNWYEVIKE